MAVCLIVSGSRSFVNPHYQSLLRQCIIESVSNIGEIIAGGAVGVDSHAANYAKTAGISFKEFPVTKDDWDTHQKKAGILRNAEMLRYALNSGQDSAIIALWDGKSRGTEHMIKLGLVNPRISLYVYIAHQTNDGVRFDRTSNEVVRKLLGW